MNWTTFIVTNVGFYRDKTICIGTTLHVNLWKVFILIIHFYGALKSYCYRLMNDFECAYCPSTNKACDLKWLFAILNVSMGVDIQAQGSGGWFCMVDLELYIAHMAFPACDSWQKTVAVVGCCSTPTLIFKYNFCHYQCFSWIE